MLDALTPTDGKDLQLADSIAPKAGNVVNVQLGSLRFAPDFGVDLKYFIASEFQFQAESFKAYLVQRLTQHQINVSKVVSLLDGFTQNNTFTVGEIPATTGGISV